MRIIEFTVSDGTVSPVTAQYAGVQGERNAACVEFALPDSTIAADEFIRIDAVDGSGGYHSSGHLTLSEGKVNFPLDDDITGAGGVAQLHLIIGCIGEDGIEQYISASYPARVYFASSEYGSRDYGNYKRGLSGLMKCTADYCSESKAAADTAENAADSAEDSAEAAAVYAGNAQSCADDAAEYMNTAKECADSAEADYDACAAAKTAAENAKSAAVSAAALYTQVTLGENITVTSDGESFTIEPFSYDRGGVSVATEFVTISAPADGRWFIGLREGIAVQQNLDTLAASNYVPTAYFDILTGNVTSAGVSYIPMSQAQLAKNAYMSMVGIGAAEQQLAAI